jgi:TatA/E family protein of Tat protein translocase
MPSLGAGELIVIFVLVLLLFGPNRLPELARGLGKGMREVRKITSEFQSQLAAITDIDDEKPISKPALPVAAQQPLRLDQIHAAPAPAPTYENDAPPEEAIDAQPALPFDDASPVDLSQPQAAPVASKPKDSIDI